MINTSLKRAIPFLLSLLCLILPSSCSTNHNEKKFYDTLNIAISHDPMSLDPRMVRLSKDISIAQSLYEGLVREHHLSPQLALAQDFQVSADKRVYTFHLKKAFWSNGDPVTAYDFEESLKQIHRLEVSCPSRLPNIIKNSQAVINKQLPLDSLGIKAINDHILEITLETPVPFFLELLAHPSFFPVHKSLRDSYISSGDRSSFFISNGPFVIQSYQPQNHLIIKKNPLYHEKHLVHLETIKFQIVPDSHTAIQLLKSHLIDWIGSPWSSPISKEDQYNIPAPFLHNYPVLSTTSLICHVNNTPTNSLALRKAIEYAINKDSLLQFVHYGKVANSFLPPELSELQTPSLSMEERRHLARVYFKQAQKELSPQQLADLSIIYPIDSLHLNAIVQEIQQQLKATLGLHVPIHGMEYHCFLDKRSKGEFTLATGKWVADFPKPASFLASLGSYPDESCSCVSRWSNRTYAQSLEALFSPQADVQDQITAEKLIDEELPVIPLYHFDYLYAANPNIQNIYTSLLGHVDLKETFITK